MRIIAKADDGSEVELLEGPPAVKLVERWMRMRFEQLPPEARKIVRRLAPECGDHDCPIHAAIREKVGRCEAARSDGERCVLRAGHAGSHLIVKERWGFDDGD